MRTPPKPIVLAVLACLALVPRAWSGVLISELCDPKNNYMTDRFIEIYNSGPDAVDLTGWSVVAVANSADGHTWTLSGTLPAGEARVCGYTAPVTGFTVNFPSASWNANNSSGGAYNWNGQTTDGVKLKNGSGTVVDNVLGMTFTDADMVRNASVTAPNPAFTASEWTVTAVLLATNASPGVHNGSLPPPSGPRISNIVITPAVPTTSDAVSVSAAAGANLAPVSSVTLQWGLAANSLTNVIGMPLVADSTYTTSAQIPPQPAGATVFYRVQAQDESQYVSTSSTQSYMLGGGGSGAPTLLWVGQAADSSLLVTFSEPVDQASAETASYYSVGSNVALSAVRDPVQTQRVMVTFTGLTPGQGTLTVSGVSDLALNTAFGLTKTFDFVDVRIPDGYYAGTEGLAGSALRVRLHDIIKGHTQKSYDYALTAFATTDMKPTGKIWDMYSDVPGGTPPYEYTYGQTGQGANENMGYNREHSWPDSWFGGASPMHSDLWILYPTDSKVNGYRSNYPYGVVGSASTTSWNGSKLGTSATPGYSGTVFEPIDGYKGDLARGQFYVATRYFNQDQSWPNVSNTSADGAEIYPWAVAQYMAWSIADPPSWKERQRNAAVYAIQHNRNPFVDHPEFVAMIYDSSAFLDVPVERGVRSPLALRSAPNPFGTKTAIAFDLVQRGRVSLRLYDLAGREVRDLAPADELAPGTHRLEWDGRDDRGTRVEAGLYFCRLEAGGTAATRRIVFTR